jgi:thiol:disulfide interchange protein DsbA
MNTFSRRRLLVAGLTMPLAWASGHVAAASADPREGDEYQRLATPQPTYSAGQIEVLDFFWYGCPHCYHLLPAMEDWRLHHKQADVSLRHVPVDFGDPRREPHTQMYCALQVLDKVDELHVRVFDAMQRDHRRLNTETEIADFMAANGIARDKWLSTYRSFSVANMVSRARATYQAYGIDGTPTIAIDGRFLTSPTMAKNAADANRSTIATLDFLIERVRRERRRRT